MLVGTLSIYNNAKQADKAIKSVKHTNTLNYLRGQNQKKKKNEGQDSEGIAVLHARCTSAVKQKILTKRNILSAHAKVNQLKN